MTGNGRRWAIVRADWAATDDGGQALVNRRVVAYGASMGQARLITLQLNRAGSGAHWSIEPVPTDAEGEPADGSPSDRPAAPVLPRDARRAR